MIMATEKVSRVLLKRLPHYLNYLKNLPEDTENISINMKYITDSQECSQGYTYNTSFNRRKAFRTDTQQFGKLVLGETSLFPFPFDVRSNQNIQIFPAIQALSPQLIVLPLV